MNRIDNVKCTSNSRNHELHICIAGKNAISIEAVQYLMKLPEHESYEILILPNTTDTGVDSWQPSLRKYANMHNIRIVALNELYEMRNLIFISLEYNKIINVNRFKSTRLYNIHFSLLPKYKGVYTSTMPILNGESHSGVTLHEIDEGIDTGKIIDQISFPIDIGDVSRDLYYNYMKYGQKLFKSNIACLINNTYETRMQSNINASYYSKEALNYGRIEIDLNKTSYEIYNQIRALIFPEYQLPEINGLKISRVRITDEKIQKCLFDCNNSEIIISGMDGFKIIGTLG